MAIGYRKKSLMSLKKYDFWTFGRVKNNNAKFFTISLPHIFQMNVEEAFLSETYISNQADFSIHVFWYSSLQKVNTNTIIVLNDHVQVYSQVNGYSGIAILSSLINRKVSWFKSKNSKRWLCCVHGASTDWSSSSE